MSDPRGTRDRMTPGQYRRGYLRYRSALQDPVTGLPAVAAVIDRLRTELDNRRRLGVVTVETLHLDVVESLYGWQTVDRILGRVAEVLQETIGAELPAAAVLAINRRAGDRFVFFVLEQDGGREIADGELGRPAQQLSAKLDKAFQDEAFRGLNPELEFRCGHAILAPDPFHRFERRIHGAVELALRSSRSRSRRRELGWAEELQRIIRDSAVSSVFQPVVDLADGEILGYEAFVRGPQDSMFETPGSMFDLSSRMGMDAELDRVCLRAALDHANGQFGDRSLFLNVLPERLQQAAEVLVGQPNPQRLVLELSEKGRGLDRDRAMPAVEALRSVGIRLALDDAGTGPDTREVIEWMQPDYIKLDLSLVRNIHKSLMKQEVLTTLISIGAPNRAEVIAEGIECEEEAKTVRETGARYGQGYLYAVPSPVSSPLLGAQPKTMGR